MPKPRLQLPAGKSGQTQVSGSGEDLKYIFKDLSSEANETHHSKSEVE